jgi:hypothetical protein
MCVKISFFKLIIYFYVSVWYHTEWFYFNISILILKRWSKYASKIILCVIRGADNHSLTPNASKIQDWKIKIKAHSPVWRGIIFSSHWLLMYFWPAVFYLGEWKYSLLPPFGHCSHRNLVFLSHCHRWLEGGPNVEIYRDNTMCEMWQWFSIYWQFSRFPGELGVATSTRNQAGIESKHCEQIQNWHFLYLFWILV